MSRVDTEDPRRALPVELVRTLDVVVGHPPGRPPFIASGSGLELCGDWAYVAVDDDVHVGVFHCSGDAPGALARVLPGELPEDADERKRLKPDVETVMFWPTPDGGPREGMLVGIPSGSTERRRHGFTCELDHNGALVGTPRPVDFSDLFVPLAEELGEVNIEGACLLDDQLLLMCRNTTGVNHIAAVASAAAWEDVAGGVLLTRGLERLTKCELGQLEDVALGFSDAACVGGRVLFTASAEATGNCYDDGAITGSVVGWLSSDGTAVETHRIDSRDKVEGLAVHSQVGSELDLRLVTDNDDPSRPSRLLATRMPAAHVLG